ncbi:MAG TPA: amidohydrolase family protein [Burkholderiales bacterium]|nr:amidohydrolase family protein [Burkholderiales bacterium]
MKRFSIRGAEVLTEQGAQSLDIWIEAGRVAALTAPGAAPYFNGETSVVDGRGQLAIPGLFNGHTHSQSALQQGAVPGEPLDVFIMRSMARRAPRSERMLRIGALFHAMSMLKRGITGCIDHVRDGLMPTARGIGVVLQAYRDIGIRAAAAPMYEDRMYLDSLPIDAKALPPELRERLGSARRPPPEAYFEMMEELLPWRGVDGRLDVLLGVDGPQRCTPRLLEMAGDFASRHGMGLHTHLLEAKTQHLLAPHDHGGSFVRYLDRFGLINERSSLAHFVWCTDEDIALAAERGVTVVHNPVSNLILGSGILPAAKLTRAGVSMALGTDGQSGSPPSILEQAKFASLLSRVCDTDPAHWLGPAETFRMAAQRRQIAPGMQADLALIDVTGALWRPRGELYHHLVQMEDGSNVRSVFVEGELVVKEGRCLKINEADVLEEAHALAAENARANAGALAVADQDAPHVLNLVLPALERRVAANRFADLR